METFILMLSLFLGVFCVYASSTTTTKMKELGGQGILTSPSDTTTTTIVSEDTSSSTSRTSAVEESLFEINDRGLLICKGNVQVVAGIEAEDDSAGVNNIFFINNEHQFDFKEHPCDAIEGDFTITQTSFTDLEMFNHIQIVVGKLKIESNLNLRTMKNAFKSLKWVLGVISISTNPKMDGMLRAFPKLEQVSGIRISNNDRLVRLRKIFRNLPILGKYGVTIKNNQNLLFIDESLNHLLLETSVKEYGIDIRHNDALKEVTTSFKKLKYGSIRISDNAQLGAVNQSFVNLNTIMTKRQNSVVNESGYLIIKRNPMLSSMSAGTFGKLKWVNGDVYVTENSAGLNMCLIFSKLLSAFTARRREGNSDPPLMYWEKDTRTYNFPDSEYVMGEDPSKDLNIFYDTEEDHEKYKTSFRMQIEEQVGKEVRSVEKLRGHCEERARHISAVAYLRSWNFYPRVNSN
jgi:hypothetical protein